MEATNTDANLVLGRLGESLIGGDMTLQRDLAVEAIERRVAAPLGLGVTEAAAAVIRVANANMADAVRLTSIRRGHDPRDFALVVFGGAGPLHGAALARELSIPTVLVPPSPGITSALGCLLVDVRHDLSSMYLGQLAQTDLDDLESHFLELEAEARRRLEAENIPPANVHLARSIDMRYYGQWRSIAVPVEGRVASLQELGERFHAMHAREHTFRRQGASIEMYRLNLTAVGITQKAELPRHQSNGGRAAAHSERPVFFDEAGQTVSTEIYRRGDLSAGTVLHGPAIIEQLDSTTVVPPGVRAEIDDWLNIRLHVQEN